MLTKTEKKVLSSLTQGISNRQIATQLEMTDKTVKFHLTNIYKKTNTKSRLEIVSKVLSNTINIE